MAKIVVECSNPNDMDEVEALVDQVAGKCNVTYFKQHQGMVEAGTSKSKSESARIIAEDTEESHGAVRKRIERGEKESGQPVQQNSITPDNQESTEEDPPEKFDSGRGGQREGAGRKPKPIHLVTEAMQFAIMAKTHLESIRANDPEREKALIYIKDWINTQLRRD